MTTHTTNNCEDAALVVISYYSRRPIEPLRQLLQSLCERDAGGAFKVAIVVNRADDSMLNLDFEDLKVDIHYRDNVGMNIGAWDYGWRRYTNFSFALFLQDDCYLVRDGWLSALAEKHATGTSGLIGESINTSWNLSWKELRNREKNVQLPEHNVDGKSANRIDIYLKQFSEWGILAGQNGLHIRALSWSIREATLSAMNGFPIGNNYAECIAAEIAVSKKVQQLGLPLSGFSTLPFHFFRHKEWNQNVPGGDFTKLSARDREIKSLELQVHHLETTLHTCKKIAGGPKWKLALAALRGTLSKSLNEVLSKTVE